jgi:hypothetical protein
MRTSALGLVLVTTAIACAAAPVSAPALAFTAPPPAAAGERLTVFISDLHFGPPDPADISRYSPLDDFRWPAALHGFLAEISRLGKGNTDLVVLGDLFELWQHPATPCPDRGADFGCSERKWETWRRRSSPATTPSSSISGASPSRAATACSSSREPRRDAPLRRDLAPVERKHRASGRARDALDRRSVDVRRPADHGGARPPDRTGRLGVRG